MLQWFISFPEFAEFTEILFYLEKTQMTSADPDRVCDNGLSVTTERTERKERFETVSPGIIHCIKV